MATLPCPPFAALAAVSITTVLVATSLTHHAAAAMLAYRILAIAARVAILAMLA